MKLIDKYILRSFMQNFLFGLLCFLVIFILVDLFENLDKFLDRKLPSNLLIQYYIYFTPEILKLITPVAMLLASLFTISRFITFSELTAMKSSGISIYRYLFPIFIFGIIITILSIYFNGWIVPHTNSKKIEMERNYLGKDEIKFQIQNFYIQDKSNKIIGLQTYDRFSKSANNVTIQIFNKDTLGKLNFRFDAKFMLWDSVKKDWKFSDLYSREFLYEGKEKINFTKSIYAKEIKEIGNLLLTPDLILKQQIKPDELTIPEFREFIDNLKSSGLDTAKAEVDYYSKISFPFANLVTIIFGVSVSSNRRKGGAALQFGISLIVSFFYLGFVKISQVFGYNGDLNPIFTAWLANILFFVASVINFMRLNRS